MSASSLTQQPNGLEIDVDNLKGTPNKAVKKGEYPRSLRGQAAIEEGAHRPNPSLKNLRTAIAVEYQHSSLRYGCDRP